MSEIDIAPSTSWLQEWRSLPSGQRKGLQRFLVFLGVLTLVLIKPLFALAFYAAGDDLHSHILLIPFVCVYLVWIRRQSLPVHYQASPWIASAFATAGLAALGTDWWTGNSPPLFSLGFVCWVMAGGFAFLGRRWMTAAAFPAAFLVFMIPLPDGLAEVLEEASRAATAEAVTWFFHLTGMPFVRDGYDFQLSELRMEIARECSGIRSSWVLFITSLLASNMLLMTNSRRALLTLIVIPLGVMRNAFRIVVIGWLCVDIGPHMIDSYIHHHGGPIFFALSLVPLFLLLGWLRRGEARSLARKRELSTRQLC